MAEQIGDIPCLCCGERIPVKRTSGGALSVNCPWCDMSAYAKNGTQAQRIIGGRMKANEPAPAAPAKANAPATTTAPAPRQGAGTLLG